MKDAMISKDISPYRISGVLASIFAFLVLITPVAIVMGIQIANRWLHEWEFWIFSISCILGYSAISIILGVGITRKSKRMWGSALICFAVVLIAYVLIAISLNNKLSEIDF